MTRVGRNRAKLVEFGLNLCRNRANFGDPNHDDFAPQNAAKWKEVSDVEVSNVRANEVRC